MTLLPPNIWECMENVLVAVETVLVDVETVLVDVETVLVVMEAVLGFMKTIPLQTRKTTLAAKIHDRAIRQKDRRFCSASHARDVKS